MATKMGRDVQEAVIAMTKVMHIKTVNKSDAHPMIETVIPVVVAVVSETAMSDAAVWEATLVTEAGDVAEFS